MIRKQTKFWQTREGKKVRICDMDDAHLENTIRFLERAAEAQRESALTSAYLVESMLQGEMALVSIESEINRLEESDPSEFLPDVYEAMLLERQRREEQRRSAPLPWH